MYLSKRYNGIYYIYYTNRAGNKTSKSTGERLKSNALKYLNEFQEKFNSSDPIKLDAFIFQFLKRSERLFKDSHFISLKFTLKKFREFAGNPTLSEIKPQIVREYVERRFREVSPYTVRRDISTLSSLFNYAISLNIIELNPVKNIQKPKLPERQPLYFTREEFSLFSEVVRDQDSQLFNLITLGVNTGMRLGELLQLQERQVNLIERKIILDNQSHITKTSKVRTIPLNDKAFNVLNSMELKSNLFNYSRDQVSKRFRKYKARAGINKKLTFHSLRHTFASWLIQAGDKIVNVSKLLGHSDIKTTMIYSHIAESDLSESVNLL